MNTVPDTHPTVSRNQWLAARKALLAREKELTRLHDEVARERRELPWERVDKDYVFQTPQGPRRLADLFDGRSQLFVQHFMLGPGWEQGCKSCSFMADHNDCTLVHLANRDVTFVAVSRAPIDQIERFRQRMGWQFQWVSSFGTSFNYDYRVSFERDDMSSGKVDYNYEKQPFPHEEAPGISIFYRDDEGGIFHTYSRYGRGVEVMMHTYALLDLVPKGRDEDELEFTMAWVRHHDRYEHAATTQASTTQAAKSAGCCSSHD